MNFLVPLGLAGLTLALIFAAAGRFLPWLPQRIVRWAARRLADAETADRFGEEWAAELDTIDSRQSRLRYALGRLLLLPLAALEAWKGARARRGLGPVGPAPVILPEGAHFVRELIKAGMTDSVVEIQQQPEMGYTIFKAESGAAIAITGFEWSDRLPSKLEYVPEVKGVARGGFRLVGSSLIVGDVETRRSGRRPWRRPPRCGQEL